MDKGKQPVAESSSRPLPKNSTLHDVDVVDLIAGDPVMREIDERIDHLGKVIASHQKVLKGFQDMVVEIDSHLTNHDKRLVAVEQILDIKASDP